MKPTRLFAHDPKAAPLPGQLPAGGHGLEVRHEGGRHVADLLGHDVARLLRHRHQRGHRLVVAPLLLLQTDVGIRPHSLYIKVKVELPGQNHSCCRRKVSWAASCRRSEAESSPPWRRRPGRRWCGSPSRTSPAEARCSASKQCCFMLNCSCCLCKVNNLQIKGGWCGLGHKLMPSRPRTVLSSSAIAITSYNPTHTPATTRQAYTNCQ